MYQGVLVGSLCVFFCYRGINQPCANLVGINT
jgi:hypothetical protein